jgi:hypothetical protein
MGIVGARSMPKESLSVVESQVDASAVVQTGAEPFRVDISPPSANDELWTEEPTTLEETPEEAFVSGLSMGNNLGNELNPVQSIPVETTPSDPTSVSQEEGAGRLRAREVSPDVAKLYHEQFGIAKEDLASLEGFDELSVGQQKLVLENLSQLTIGRIREEASDGHDEAINEEKKTASAFGSAFLGKVWVGVRESFLKDKDIGEREKRLASEFRTGGLPVHKQTMAQLVHGIKTYGPEVIEKDGALEIQLLETQGLSPELAREVESFNQEGTAFSRIPSEWALPTATSEERAKFQEARQSYEAKRAFVLERMSEVGGKAQAFQGMAQAEAQIEMERFMKTSPDASKELEAIEEQGVWTRALKSIATERGAYIAGGAIARTALGAVAGLAAAPAVAMVMGSMRSWKKTTEELRKQDRDRALGKEAPKTKDVAVAQERIQAIAKELVTAGTLEKKQALQTELQSLEVVVRGTQSNMVEAVRSDATLLGYRGAQEKIEALVQKLSSEDDAQSLAQLARRLNYTKRKISEGKMVFGNDGARLANQYALMKTIAEGEALLAGRVAVDSAGEKAEERLVRMLQKRDEEIHDARFKHKVRQATKAGLIGATFAFVGASVAHAGESEGVSVLPDADPKVEEGASVDTGEGVMIEETSLSPMLETPVQVGVVSGDRLGALLARSTGIGEGEIIRALSRMSPEELLRIGVTSGDMNRILPGEQIDTDIFLREFSALGVRSEAVVGAGQLVPTPTESSENLEPIPLSFHSEEETPVSATETASEDESDPDAQFIATGALVPTPTHEEGGVLSPEDTPPLTPGELVPTPVEESPEHVVSPVRITEEASALASTPVRVSEEETLEPPERHFTIMTPLENAHWPKDKPLPWPTSKDEAAQLFGEESTPRRMSAEKLQKFLGRYPNSTELDAYLASVKGNPEATKSLLLSIKDKPLSVSGLEEHMARTDGKAVLTEATPGLSQPLVERFASRPHMPAVNTTLLSDLEHNMDLPSTVQKSGTLTYGTTRQLSYREIEVWNVLGQLRAEGSGPELAKDIARAQYALVTRMQTSQGPISPLEVYQILESEKLSDIIPLQPDVSIDAYRASKGLPTLAQAGLALENTNMANKNFDSSGMDKYPRNSAPRPAPRAPTSNPADVLRSVKGIFGK